MKRAAGDSAGGCFKVLLHDQSGSAVFKCPRGGARPAAAVTFAGVAQQLRRAAGGGDALISDRAAIFEPRLPRRADLLSGGRSDRRKAVFAWAICVHGDAGALQPFR
ncbi:MAG: hypothetical protein H6646_08990 [Anaerolineales bacterium]|nr:hypothetical protein [Anaerolineales bacterium]